MITKQENFKIQTVGKRRGKKFTMSANGEAFSAIMDTNYPEKVDAALTELSVNMIDSHRKYAEVNGKPVGRKPEIELPTVFSPVLRMRDYGVSMSADFMESEGEWEESGYTVAFSSTKRENNLEDGAKGIGRLTAFCLSDIYTAVCFRDGVRRVYSVFRDEERVPDIQLQHEGPTDEPDGFLVEIPVSPDQVDSFEAKAKEIFRFFPEEHMPIVKSHEDFEIPKNEYRILAKDGSFGLRGVGHDPKAIMGCYCYPVESRFIPDLTDMQAQILNSGLIMHFELGSLGVQTNRRGLHYNDFTIKAIKAKLDSIMPEIEPAVLANFEGKNIYEKMSLRADLLHRDGKLSGLSQLVKMMVDKLSIPPHLDLITYGMFTESYTRNWKGKLNKNKATALGYFTNVSIYYSYKKSDLRLKARKFFEDSSNENRHLIFIVLSKKNSRPEDFEKQFGLDIFSFSNAADLPCDAVSSTGRKVKTLLFDEDSYYLSTSRWSRRGYKMKDCWEEQEKMIDVEDEIVYVLRTGYQLSNDEPITDIQTLKMKIEQYKTMTGLEVEVYGLTKGQYKKKGDDWVSFDELYKAALVRYRKSQEDIASVAKYLKLNYVDFEYITGTIEKLELDNDHLLMVIWDEYKRAKKEVSKLNYELVDINKVPVSTDYKYCIADVKKNFPLLFGIEFNSYRRKPDGFWPHLKQYVLDRS